jgi:hypothetical protein
VPVIGRVAQADQDGRVLFDLVGVPAASSDRLVDATQMPLLDPRVGERVREVQPQPVVGAVTTKGTADKHLRYGVWAGHQLEADQPPSHVTHRRVDQPGPKLYSGLGAPVDDVDEVGAGAHRRIQRHHLGIGEPQSAPEADLEQLVDETNLRVDDIRRRVVGPGVLTQARVVDREEALVEVPPGIAGPLLQPRPVDRGDRAGQGGQADEHLL